MWTRPLLLAAIAATLPPVAAQLHRVEVTNLQPLMRLAIDQGRAHGVLVGEAAQVMAARFRSTAPIEIDVTVVKALADPACRRLEVVTAQRSVTEDAQVGPRDMRFSYQVNYCADGRFPEERTP